ncbi:hypothetical protein HC723_12455 [Vibrio sp. S11_S32]|uniref:DUF6279 family lipoprotein n=1 Tax=Vibrio sp. S11_S32 TaxID=2720225 RepID=UPI0016800F62|nr:DUF6279 family lipoprotein [Vibrio sp. S11_S32]MBD1577241.1 hypothetical protein [Vibrio sp. S11_S32]
MTKRICIILSLLLMTACSTQFFYNRLDWMAAQYVDRYVSLSDQQQASFKQSVREVQAWHRAEQLPLYIKQIDYLLTLTPSQANKQQVAQQYKVLKDFSTQLVTHFMPHLYRLFMSLDQQQADELFDSLQRKYEDRYADDNDLSDQQRREKSQQRMIDILETWIGDLSASQVAMVKRWSLERLSMRQEWLKQQQINKAELQVLFVQRNDSAAFQQKFSTTLLNPDRLYPESLTQKRQHNRTVTITMLVDVIQAMNPEQFEHYHQQLRDWRERFEDLI